MTATSHTTVAAQAAVRGMFATARGSPPPLEGVDASSTNPVALIQRWIDDGRARGEREPESFSLATCSAECPDGAPDAAEAQRR